MNTNDEITQLPASEQAPEATPDTTPSAIEAPVECPAEVTGHQPENPEDLANPQPNYAQGEDSPGDVADRELAEGHGGCGDEPGDVPDIQALVEEAERRGYLRGRNESIEHLLSRRSELESPSVPDNPELPQAEPMILSHIRTSVWENA